MLSPRSAAQTGAKFAAARSGMTVKSRWRWLLAAFVMLVGWLLAMPPRWFTARQEISEYNLSLLDASWQLDLPARLARGEWAGRDFIFTYGPLYQVTHALGLWVDPGNVAALIRWQAVPEGILTMSAVWLLLATTGASLRWRSAVYLLWAWLWPPYVALTFLYNVGLKPLAGLCLAAVAASFLGEACEKRLWLRRWLGPAIWLVAGPILALYGIDLGILTLLSLLLAAGIVLVAARREPGGSYSRPAVRALRLGATALLGSALFTATLLATPAGRRCLVQSWEFLASYSVAMACAGTLAALAAVAAALALNLSVMVGATARLRRCVRLGENVPPAVPTLLGAACFAVAWNRYPLPRSDWFHVWPVIAVTLLVVGGMVPCWLRGQRLPGAWLFLALWVPACFYSPGVREPPSLGGRLLAVFKFDFRSASLDIRGERVRGAAQAAAEVPSPSLYVWPYESVVALVAGRSNPSYLVQSYAAFDETLANLELAHLKAVPDLPVLLFVDSAQIDGVDNLTRTPEIFRYLLDRYEFAGRSGRDFIMLQPRPAGGVEWRRRAVTTGPATLPPGDLSRALKLPPETVCRASDFFVLRIRCAPMRPLPWSKRGRIVVTFRLADGQQRIHELIVPPDGEPHDVLVTACRPGKRFFLAAFDPARAYRSTERVEAIGLQWEPLDVLSQRPSEIVLEQISVLERIGPQREELRLAAFEGND